MLRYIFYFEPQNRRKTFWQVQSLSWLILAVLPFAILHHGEVPLPDAAVLGLTRGLIGFVLSSLLLMPVLRWAWRRRVPLELPWIILVVGYCAALGWVDMTLAKFFALHMELNVSSIPVPLVSATWVFRTTAYLTWSVVYYVIQYWIDLQDSRLRLAQLQTEKQAIELQQLRAQVNPHFLFNAFNSILAEADNPKVVMTLTEGVAEFLRFSLRQTDALQELGAELDALEHYLRVEKVRFEDRFDYIIAASERARRCRVPGVLVQPLVENAIKYGQRTSRPPLRLSIEAEVREGKLMVAVANTGRWIRPEESPVSGNGIGLSNLRRRLELVYGAEATCDREEADGWVRMELQIPAEARG